MSEKTARDNGASWADIQARREHLGSAIRDAAIDLMQEELEKARAGDKQAVKFLRAVTRGGKKGASGQMGALLDQIDAVLAEQPADEAPAPPEPAEPKRKKKGKGE
jgi:hypothetical protein